MILDKLTTTKTANLPGRINVNTAPSAVLSALAPNGTPLLDVGHGPDDPEPPGRRPRRPTPRTRSS